MITIVIMSKPGLSSKHGSMSSPKEAELQSPLPGNGSNLLSLQEVPLDCSLSIPGNLNVLMVFLNGSSQMTSKTSHTQEMHKNQSKDKASNHQCSEGR